MFKFHKPHTDLTRSAVRVSKTRKTICIFHYCYPPVPRDVLMRDSVFRPGSRDDSSRGFPCRPFPVRWTSEVNTRNPLLARRPSKYAQRQCTSPTYDVAIVKHCYTAQIRRFVNRHGRKSACFPNRWFSHRNVVRSRSRDGKKIEKIKNYDPLETITRCFPYDESAVDDYPLCSRFIHETRFRLSLAFRLNWNSSRSPSDGRARIVVTYLTPG